MESGRLNVLFHFEIFGRNGKRENVVRPIPDDFTTRVVVTTVDAHVTDVRCRLDDLESVDRAAFRFLLFRPLTDK